MRQRLAVTVAAICCVMAGQALAAPPCWNLQSSESTLTFTGDQAGAPARGAFQEFDVALCFDPATAEGHLKVVVDVASLETHNSRRDTVLKGEEFFAVEKYPRAVYEAGTFVSLGDGRYKAKGRFTLRGVTKPVPVIFSLLANSKTATVQGSVVVKRLAFGVGQGRWTNTRWVGNEVTLGFELHFVRSQMRQNKRATDSVPGPAKHSGQRSPDA